MNSWCARCKVGDHSGHDPEDANRCKHDNAFNADCRCHLARRRDEPAGEPWTAEWYEPGGFYEVAHGDTPLFHVHPLRSASDTDKARILAALTDRRAASGGPTGDVAMGALRDAFGLLKRLVEYEDTLEGGHLTDAIVELARDARRALPPPAGTEGEPR